MVSIFPSLLSWQELSPLLLRLVLGAVLLYWSYKHLRSRPAATKTKVLGAIDGILGILLVIGLWTQLAALIVGLDLIVRIAKKIADKSFLSEGVNYYLILLVICISLLVTGAGWFAFDYSF